MNAALLIIVDIIIFNSLCFLAFYIKFRMSFRDKWVALIGALSIFPYFLFAPAIEIDHAKELLRGITTRHWFFTPAKVYAQLLLNMYSHFDCILLYMCDEMEKNPEIKSLDLSQSKKSNRIIMNSFKASSNCFKIGLNRFNSSTRRNLKACY